MSIDFRIFLAALLVAVLLCLWQRSEIRSLEAELSQVETSLVKAHAQAIEATLAATTQALAMRDISYAENKDAGREAQQAIHTAGPEAGRAHPDDFVPGAMSDALLMQSARVRSSCGGDSPAGTAIRAKNDAGASACGAGAGDDGAADGRLDLKALELGW